MAKPEFYTMNDIAEMLSCSVYTVRRWIKAGRLECTKAGHFVRISPQQLDKFMKANKGGTEMQGTPTPQYINGEPRYMGGHKPQPKTCPHCGEPLEPARGFVYTDLPGVYAEFQDGKPTGRYMRTIQ